MEYKIKNVEWDEDLGGLMVTVEYDGKDHEFWQQYLVDEDAIEDDYIVGTNADCWSWIDKEQVDDVNGRSSQRCILNKLPMFEDEDNWGLGDEKAWEFFWEVMDEAQEIYHKNRNAELMNELGMTEEEAEQYNINEVAVMMATGKSKEEALKALDDGAKIHKIADRTMYDDKWDIRKIKEIKAGKVEGVQYVDYTWGSYVVEYDEADWNIDLLRNQPLR